MLKATAIALVFAAASLQAQSSKDLVNKMVANEAAAQANKPFFNYVATEKSERTGGRAWTEHIVETRQGRIRFLIAEDGQPLSADRAAQERGRLAAIVNDPAAFEAKEKAQKDDEVRARQLLDLLAKGYLLDPATEEGPDYHINFRPDPNYSPSGTEEKVLHGMSGYLLINRAQMRLHHVEGRLPADVSVGFGLATVKAGSNFMSEKAPFEGQWRTVRVVSDIHGKAILFKSIAKNTDVTRSGFHRLPAPPTIAQAVALAEQPAP